MTELQLAVTWVSLPLETVGLRNMMFRHSL